MKQHAFLFLFLSCGCGTSTVMHDGEPTIGINCASEVVTLAPSPGPPLAIAVDAQRVYWTTDGGSVYAVSRDGGEPLELAPAQAADWMAMDEEHIYWTDGASSVLRVAKSGGDPSVVVRDDSVGAMSIGDGTVYWVNGLSELRAAPKDGGAATTVAQLPSTVQSLAFEGGEVFWLARSDEATVVGRGAETLYQGAGGPRHRVAQSLAADRDAVYWADATGGSIQRLSRDGGEATTVVAGPMRPWGVALADDSLFFSDMATADFAVRRVDRDGRRAGIVARIEPDAGFWFYPHAVAVADGEVFWTDQNVDSVMNAACAQ